ncbi:uncharacterized protein TNCV_3760501 [Trichonephila clavipes]|nr:uncharacterized protein TNCV_3760501 [Trichonephila clavipes]
MNGSVREGDAPPFLKLRSTCVERLEPIVENSACVEAGTTISQTPAKRCQFEQFQLYYLRRGEISGNNVLLQLLDTSYVRATRELEKKKMRGIGNEREVTLEKQKIELAKLQLAKLEKEIELQTAKNKALSLNPAAKVEEKQFETNIENMINSIRTLSLPVPTRSENFNLFFQSLERAFLTKKINDEYESEILINLLGERAHNVLLYIKEEELNDYEKLKKIYSTQRIQLNPSRVFKLIFKNAVKSSGETYIQFAARLTANFQYYCSLRKDNSF